MPIYAPTLPPRPALDHGLHPVLVIAKFDWRRLRRQKMGMFFGFCFIALLLVQTILIYVRHLINANPSVNGLQELAHQVFAQGGEFHASLVTVSGWLTTLLWFQVAFVGGAVVARDTLFRIRPLLYAHPVKPLDYLAAKSIFAMGLPFLIQLPFVLFPWAMSALIAGSHGPVWITAPIHLIPAAGMIAVLMGSVALGASSLASTPKAGFGWVLGIVLGLSAVGGIISGILGQSAWKALNPLMLSMAWPDLFCRVANPMLGWIPTIFGTLAHITLWLFVARMRTKPSEAVL